MTEADRKNRFYRIVWPHAGLIARSAMFLCRNQYESDDLSQETLIKAYRSIEQFKEETNIQSWLLTIMRNARIDWLRKNRRESGTANIDDVDPEDSRPLDESLDPAKWSDPEAMMQSFSDQEMIDAMKLLPEEIRWTLLLVDIQQLDHQTAAGVMEVPEGTVKSRAHRGRAMLRVKLDQYARRNRQ